MRAALALATAALAVGAPTAVFRATFNHVPYLCGAWGKPPAVLHITCVPSKKQTKPGSA